VLILGRFGWSAVHWAAGAGHANFIEALVKATADISVIARFGADGVVVYSVFTSGRNNLGSDGTSALHWAASQGHVSCIRALLMNGADVNVLDRCKACVMILFWIFFHIYSIIEDSDSDCSNGKTPLHHAVEHSFPEKIYTGIEPLPITNFAASINFQSLLVSVGELVDARADVNICDRYHE
jgi:hypothetical protein